MSSETIRLRQELDDANETIRLLTRCAEDEVLPFVGVAGMTVSEARIVCLIARRGRISTDGLYEAFYALRAGDNLPNVNIFRTWMVKIRKKLDAHNIAIEALHGIGYGMTPDSIARFRALAIPALASPPLQATLEQVAA